MNTNTSNSKAFNKVTSALVSLKKFHKTQNLDFLQAAESALEVAIQADPEYQDAIFYTGITKDLIGKPADSHAHFEKIVQEAEDKKIRIEAKYNLGVSYYHLYGHEFLEKAEVHFKQVLDDTSSVRLKAQVYANLAQTYAMWMILNPTLKRRIGTEEGKKEVRAHIKTKFTEYKKSQRKLLIYLFIISVLDFKLWKKVSAVSENAKGMALMYHSDYMYAVRDSIIKQLLKAEKALDKSESLAPNDWANTCDKGSLYMRLAYHYEDQTLKEKNFEKAIQLFQTVIEKLRPDYGFAFYELGRIYRLKKDFDESVKNFNKSLEIESKYRDVRDDTVNAEKSRAEEEDASFP